MATTCVPVGVTASPLLLLAAQSQPASQWASYGHIPTGLPSTTVKVAGVEFTLTVTTDMAGNPGLVAVVNPANTDEVPGTWTGGGGSIDTVSGIDYWSIPDWGAWETDYLTFPTGANTADTVYLTSSTSYGATAWDVQIRCNAATWATAAGLSNQRQLISTSTGGPFNIRRNDTGIQIESRINLTPSGTSTVFLTPTYSTLGCTNGVTQWFRFTGDATNGLRVWTGSPGSWSVVATQALPGNFASFVPTNTIRLGNGLLDGNNGRGFGGDIYACTVADSVGGTPWADLNIGPGGGPGNSSDSSWPSGGSEPDWTKGANVTHHGAVSGDVTVRFEPTTPIPLADFLATFAPTAGGFDVTEWCLDYIADGGWSVGFLKF